VKFAFLPISILGGLLAGVISKKIFELLWGMVDEEEAPEAKHRDVAMVKLALALLLEGAIFRFVRGLFDHEARRGFARITGAWPGEEAPERT
jgi:Protein of unknown function (DUF4235)